MAWIMDTVSMHRGYSVPGVVTGKPVAIGGSVGRADATGQGVVYTIEDAARRVGLEIAGATVAVQGFGNVGEATARLLDEAGARVVAITDVGGGASATDGLDVPILPAPHAGARHDRRGARDPAHRQRANCSGSTWTSSCSPRSRARSPAPTPTTSAPGSSPRARTAR